MNYRDLLNSAYAAKEQQAFSGQDGENTEKLGNLSNKNESESLGNPSDKNESESLGKMSTVEKAAGLIRRLKSYAAAAENDLDVSRAKEFDAIAGVMAELCEIVSQD